MSKNDTAPILTENRGWYAKLVAIKYILCDKVWPLEELPRLKKIRNWVALLTLVALLLVAVCILPSIVIFCTAGKGTVLSHTLLSFMFALCTMGLAIFIALSVYKNFSVFMRISLPKAIRLGKAMRMLHADDNSKACNIIRMYGISVYFASKNLADEAEENLQCTYVSGFTDPWTYQSFQNAALGSSNFCCNLEEVEKIIHTNQHLWGGHQADTADLKNTVIAGMHKEVSDITKERDKAFNERKGALARLGKAEKQLEECEKHMGIMIRLAALVTEVHPPQKITQKEIKEKYLAIGKTLGIEAVPPKYVDIFRNSMPPQFINQGGAPNQG